MKRQCGFNIIELLITIVVASILIAVAVPAFQRFIQNNRIAASSNELVSAFALGRSEAIKRAQVVTICSSVDQSTCGGTWTDGWIAMTTIAGTPAVLRVWDPLPGGLTMTALSTTTIAFDRLGTPDTTADETIRLSNPDCKPGQANRERLITLRTSGSVDVTQTDCP